MEEERWIGDCLLDSDDTSASREKAYNTNLNTSSLSTVVQQLDDDNIIGDTIIKLEYDEDEGNYLNGMGAQEKVDSASNCIAKKVEKDIDTRKVLGSVKSKKTPSHKCSLCDKVFSRKSCLNRHMKKHTGEKGFQCNICEKGFTTHWHLVRHISSKNECKKRHKCKICGDTFAEKCTLTNHMREHSGGNIYICNVCDDVFTSSDSLNMHKKTHKDTNPSIEYLLYASNTWLFREQILALNCEVPDLHYTDAQHIVGEDASDTDNGANRCFLCYKTFTKKSILNRHMGIHNKDKPYKCSVCAKSFLRKDGLIRHQRQHTTGRKVQCIECDKFVVDLKKHMAAHTREKPYICTICDAAFSFKSELIHHAKLHSGEQLFICDVCSKSFTRISSLNRHKQIHAGSERPYKCNSCGKQFGRKWNIVRHLTKHSCQTETQANNSSTNVGFTLTKLNSGGYVSST